ncbi:MAG TPA: alpha/beta hydrolase, partial [Caulobacteraceae bacterium]
GGGQTRHAWGATARMLAALGYHVLSLDLRGHGDSGWAPQGDYDFSAFRDDVRAVMDGFHRPVILVGASLGGIAALLAAGEGSREKVRALVLVDITPKVAGPGSERIMAFMTANPEGFADVHEAADAVAGYLPHRPRPKDPAGLMKNLRSRDGRLHWHWDPSFIARAASNRFDVDDRLPKAARNVIAPTLLVRGDESEIVLPEDAEAFTTLIPQAEVVVVRGAGHMVAGDQNTVFGDAVSAYLNRVAPPDL